MIIFRITIDLFIIIQGDTLKIIYAYGENDPKDEDLNKSDDYHGVNRGNKSIQKSTLNVCCYMNIIHVQ